MSHPCRIAVTSPPRFLEGDIMIRFHQTIRPIAADDTGPNYFEVSYDSNQPGIVYLRFIKRGMESEGYRFNASDVKAAFEELSRAQAASEEVKVEEG
jgi:hypothetical protein